MEKVWIPDPNDGFVLGRIVDLTDEGALVARLDKSRKEESVSFDRLYSAEADDQVSVGNLKASALTIQGILDETIELFLENELLKFNNAYSYQYKPGYTTRY